MKRVIALLLCLVMSVCFIVSCGDETPEEVHSHTFSETWSSDAQGHWYEPTCECEDAPIAKLGHADKNNDGACDICEYMIECADGHSYSEKWTVDCTNHWNAADCGHIVSGANVAAHVDTDEDGECDVCEYVINDIHTHYYDTAWTSDAEYHWHAALCEHGVEVADKAAHVINAAGYCTVCDTKVQDVDVTDIGAVLAAAAARNDKVTGGNVEYVNTIPDINIVQTHSVYFVLGTDSTYIKRTQYEAATEFWYEYISEDEVFGVTSYDGGLTLTPVSVGNDELNGYIYMPSTLADASTLDGILSALYELTKADTAKDVVTGYDADTGVYSFSYEYLFVNVITGNSSMNDSGNDDSTAGSVTNVETRLYTVEAQFKIDENYVISSAEFVVGAYNQDIDGDYVYNAEDGTYTMSADALADTYEYKVAQSSGDRKYSTAYPKETIVPQDFDLVLPNGEIAEDEIKVSAGTYVQLTLANLVPFSAQVSCINPADMSIVIANKADPDDTLYAYYWNGAIGFNPSTAGEYSVTITYEDVVKNYDLIVSPALPTSVGMYGFEWIQGYDQLVYTADVTNPGPTSMIVLEPGDTFDFAVLCSPNAAEQGVTVTVDSTDATISSVTLNDVVVFYEICDTYTAYQFKSDVVGTYNITITSTADSNITKTVTAYVGTEPGGDEQNSTTLNFNTPGNFANTSQVFTAPVAGTYVITAEGLDATTWLQIDRYDPVNDTDWTKIHTQLPYSIELAEGEELTVRLYGWSNDTAIVGTPVAVTLALEPAESTGTVIKLETPGNFANVSSVFTAPAAGTYVITAEGLDATTWLQIDRYDPVNDTDWTKIHNQLPYSIELAEGEELTVRLYGWSNDAAIVGTEVSITIALGDSGSDEGSEGNGTADSPYVITETGDYTCAFPGGWSPVWYTYTLTEGGYVTVSSTFATGWIQVGTDPNTASGNQGDGAPVSAYFPAGSVVYIGVGDWDEAVADVPFTVSFEAVASDPIDALVGTWNGTGNAIWGATITYTLTINADGTGTFVYDDGMGVTETMITYVLLNGENVNIGYVGNWAAGTLSCTYANGTFACTEGVYGESFVFTVGTSGGDQPGGDEEEQTPVYDTVIVAGANTLYFSEDEINANSATRLLTITEAGNYSFEGDLFVASVTDANGNTVTRNADYTYTLAAGEYTVTFGMFSIFGTEADAAQPLNVEKSTVQDSEDSEDSEDSAS